MAFRDFTPTALYEQPVCVPTLTVRVRGLTNLERMAVRIGANDPPSSLAPLPLGKLLKAIFGLRRPNRFANDRLEALRALAVRLSHDRTFARVDARRLALQAGLTGSEVSQAARLIGAIHT